MLQQRIPSIKQKQYQAWHDKAQATVNKNSLYHLSMNFPTLFQSKPNYLKTNVWNRGSNQFIQKTKKTKKTRNQNKNEKEDAPGTKKLRMNQ